LYANEPRSNRAATSPSRVHELRPCHWLPLNLPRMRGGAVPASPPGVHAQSAAWLTAASPPDWGCDAAAPDFSGGFKASLLDVSSRERGRGHERTSREPGVVSKGAQWGQKLDSPSRAPRPEGVLLTEMCRLDSTRFGGRSMANVGRTLPVQQRFSTVAPVSERSLSVGGRFKQMQTMCSHI